MNYSAHDELKKLDDYYPNSDLKNSYKKHREEIIKLLTTIDHIWQHQQLDKNTFEIVYNGLQNPWMVVYYYIVGEQINKMIGKIAGIEEVIYQGIQDKNWQTRFNTVVIMKAIDNQDLKTKIIDLGMSDKSRKVREMAEDVKINYLGSSTDSENQILPKTENSWLKKLFGSSESKP
jgi:hypothetical protein